MSRSLVGALRRLRRGLARARASLAVWRLVRRLGPPGRRRVGRAPLPQGVNLIGFARASLGLSQPLRAAAAALSRAGVPFAIIDLRHPQPGELPADLAAHQRDDAPFDVSLHFYNPPELPLALARLGMAGFVGRRNVGVWFWELDRLAPSFRLGAAVYDEVWGASRPLTDVLREAGSRVRHVAWGLALPEVLPEPARARWGIPAEAFAVFVSADVASWGQRKNPRGALEAFMQAFGDDPGVCLVLRHYDSWSGGVPPLVAEARDRLGRRLVAVTEMLSREALLGLVRSCDVVLDLHRAEGLGLVPLEALAMGVPALVTACPVMQGFAPWPGLGLVPATRVPVPRGAYPHAEGCTWSEPDVAAAAATLRVWRDAPPAVAPGFLEAHFPDAGLLAAIDAARGAA